ncbi:TonB-dependent receptor [Fulvivirgaceae bacterium BMA12]|uniref:TonB-dependent receptor n=1 Tax=Agaribacillus aureus TaxID=3051825 RepID=A0ABT8KZD0_9BACT|nr:TonB-dependent receptor [Fulvivirgaceae bacterium BMA12]
MRNKHLLLIKKVTKITFYSIILQCLTMGMLLANKSNAQVKSVKEVKVDLTFKSDKLIGILKTIENHTYFEFSYDQGVVDINQQVNLTDNNYSGDLYNLLLAISETANVKFKQVQRNITMSNRPVKLFRSRNLVEIIEEKEISGTVKDETGAALPGVNVLLKGTTVGSITDADGKFTIAVPDDNAVLVFSFIGYLSQEVVVGVRSVIDISLIADVTALEEVIVLGYGSQRRQDISGAVSTISGDKINNVVTGNATQALLGKAAGVRVEVNGGAPGATANVIIRGTGSLSNQNPLYVIDGVFSDDMSFLNPADIESIQVLKDAAAASIYGARAGQGVIIVTTKNGKINQPMKLDIDASVGFAKAVRQLDFLNAADYVANREAAYANDNVALTPNFFDFDPSVDSDIQDESLQTGIVQNYGARLSGGGANSTYSISINRLDQEGPVKESQFERTSVRLNTELTKGRFQVNQSLFVARSINRPNEEFGRENGHLPVIPIYSETNEGGFAAADNGVLGVTRSTNFLGQAVLREQKDTRDNILGNIGASFEIIDGLKYKLNLSVNYNNLREFTFTPTFFMGANENGRNDVADLNDQRSTFISTIVENLLTYERSIKGHNFSILAGYSEQKDNTETIGVSVENFISNDTRTIDAGIDFVGRGGSTLPRNIRSQFGRINYNYEGKYLFTASIRRDGSSNFGAANRFGVFPSFSLGWNIAHEDFFSSDLISDLKVRGSWGKLGSDNLQPFQFVSALNITSQYTFGTAQQRRNGVSQIVFANPDLKWEETTTANVGFEASLLGGKVDVIVDYYFKESEDILVELPLNPSSGTTEPIPFNAATIENNGFEFFATYRNNERKFKYSVSGMFATLNNEVKNLGEGVTPITGGAFTSGGLAGTLTEAGLPVGYFYGFQTNGIYQNQAEVDAETVTGRTIAPGDFRFVDTNGDGAFGNDDKVFLGSPIPDFEYSINFSGSYKGLDLGLFFQGVSGNEIFNGQLYHGVFQPNSPKRAIAGEAWTPTNGSTTVPKPSSELNSQSHLESDFYVEDGSYFRLQNISLGYSLPSGMIDKLSLTKLRAYVNVENAFVIDSYNGYYPEVGRALRRGNTLFDRGVDENVYPVARTVTIGIQASF